MLGSFHQPLQCFPGRDRDAALLYCDEVDKAEVHQNFRGQMDFLQSPQEEETLVCFLDQG